MRRPVTSFALLLTVLFFATAGGQAPDTGATRRAYGSTDWVNQIGVSAVGPPVVVTILRIADCGLRIALRNPQSNPQSAIRNPQCS